MPRVSVMFDIDGVLADFIEGFTTLAHTMYGTRIVKTEKQQSWTVFPGLSSEQVKDVWKSVVHSTRFWRSLKPLISPSCVQAIRQLREQGSVQYFVTNRYGDAVHDQTEQWLREVLFLDNPTVIVSKNKGEIARAIGITHSLDDKAANASCIAWMTNDRTRSFLLSRPYNRVHPDFLASSVTRVKSVEEFLAHINTEDTYDSSRRGAPKISPTAEGNRRFTRCKEPRLLGGWRPSGEFQAGGGDSFPLPGFEIE